MIIGVTGTNGSGKKVLVDILQERGFKKISLSDFLREDAKQRGLDWTSRIVLQELGNAYREQHGPDGLMRSALASITRKLDSYVIDSVRTPGEVEAMRAYNKRTYLFAVDADPRTRYKRTIRRTQETGRDEDACSYEAFIAREAAENTINPIAQQLRATIKLADKIFINDFSTKEEFITYSLIELAKLKGTYVKKKTWDEYFMNFAVEAGDRSSCCKRRVGAVMVKDRKILTTGYNGVPRNLPNCDEGECQRCNDPTIASGTRLDECICIHAEQNAIIHAASSGVSIRDADIYTTAFPCITCAKMLAQLPVKRVYYFEGYGASDERSAELFRKSGIETILQRVPE